MNLAQIVTAIGQRSGQIGPRDVTACRNFVGIRYNQLWQAFLWKDALVEYVVNIDPTAAYAPTSPYMPTKGHLILPSIIGNVIAVRSNQDKMNVERPMMYFRVGQDQFSKTGQPCEFYLLSSCAWEFDVIERLRLGLVNVADAAQNVTIDSLGDDGVSVNRVVTPLQIADVNLNDSDRIDSILKPVTQGQVKLKSVTLAGSIIPAGAVYVANAYLAAGWTPGALYTVTFGANDTGVIIGDDNFPSLGVGTTMTVNAPAIGMDFGLSGAGSVTGAIQLVVVSDIITLQATDTAAPKRQRVRFVSIPDTAITIRVLGKRVTPQLTDDNDEPAIKGMDGLLYAMATYDMAHRDEFSKVGAAEAQILLTESVGPNFLSNGVPGGFLKKLIEEETDQAAFNSRIMPEHGFGGHELDGCNPTKGTPY